MFKKSSTFAFIHFLITFINDLLFINRTTSNIVNYIIVKISLLLFLIIIYYLIFKVLNNKDKKLILKIFLLLFIPLLILFFLIYPGIWSSDTFDYLKFSKTCDFLYYLHYITSIYYSLALSILPLAISVPLLQIFLYSLVVTYIIYNLIKIFDIKKWYKYLLYIVFILPMTLFYAIYPNRPCIYGVLYLLFISILLFKIYKKESLSKKEIIQLLVLSSLLATLRSEGIYLIIFSPLIISILTSNKKIINALKIFLMSFVLFFIISLPQNINTIYKDKTYNIKRFIPSIVNPLGWMIDNGANITKEDYNNINKIINIDKLLEYPVLNDSRCMWLNNCTNIDNITTEELNMMKKSYISFILNNKKLYLQAKYKTFLLASGFTQNSTLVNYNIFDRTDESVTTFLNDYKLTKPINKDLREKVTSLLEGKSMHSHDPLKSYLYINNLIIPIITLFITCIILLLKKQIKYLILLVCPLGHALMIFLTAPASYFTYYYPVYLVGYFILLFDIIVLIKKGGKKI